MIELYYERESRDMSREYVERREGCVVRSRGRVMRVDSDVASRMESSDIMVEACGVIFGGDSNRCGCVRGDVSSRMYYRSDVIYVEEGGEERYMRELLSRRRLCIEGDVVEFEWYVSGVLVMRNESSGMKYMLSEGGGGLRSVLDYYGEGDVLERDEGWFAIGGGILCPVIAMLCFVVFGSVGFCVSLIIGLVLFVFMVFILETECRSYVVKLLVEDGMNSMRRV